MWPFSYRPWAARIVRWAPQRSLREASCCSVEVMNGADGRRVVGFSVTDRTDQDAPSSAATSAVAAASSRRSAPALAAAGFSCPSSPKSPPPATRAPSIATSFAGNSPPSATNVPEASQYPAERNAIRARSRSTTRRVATDCTRPADSPDRTFFHSTGETSKPNSRSTRRRASWASTRSWSRSRVFAAASLIASRVISWNTIRRTGTFGLSTSRRCQAIASPSRSSSVASHSSSAEASAFFSSATLARLLAVTT